MSLPAETEFSFNREPTSSLHTEVASFASLPIAASSSLANRRLVLNQFGGPEGFALVSDGLPEPGPTQVRIRVLAASVQFTDVIIRKGRYFGLPQKPPLTLGYDFVGEVDAVGAEVKGLRVGDRVADMSIVGSYARYRLSEADSLVLVPRSVDPAQATTLVLSWMTAYQLLHRHAKVTRGQRVLIHGAAGAVGQALLRLGAMAGLEMFGTARAKRRELVSACGATPVAYDREDFTQVLKAGVDVVFDGLGEAGFARSWSIVRAGGFLSAYGFSQLLDEDASPARVAYYLARLALWNALPNGKRAGVYMIPRFRRDHPAWFQQDLTKLFELLAAGEIAPRVSAPIALGAIAEAHRRIEQGGLQERIVLAPWLD